MLANNIITSDVHPQWYFEYTRIYTEVDCNEQKLPVTPQECRLRDNSYTANVRVDVRYIRGNQSCSSKGLLLCRIPVMLRSCLCSLSQKSQQELIELNECPYDPGGYFIVRGVEKVILIQEQLSKNRIIVEQDKKGHYIASVASSTHERKSKTTIVSKNRCFYLHHNTFSTDIPILIVLKAMGLSSDQAFLQHVGSQHHDLLLPSIDECARLGVFTVTQALDYISSRIRTTRLRFALSSIKSKSKHDMTRDNLASVIFSHVSVVNYDFTNKILFSCLCLQRICQVMRDPKLQDDRDYYGNKRLELAGQLLALLFEDLFKRHNAELKRQTDHALSKPNRADPFDVIMCFNDSLISNSLSNAISTGNWHVKRFKMERAGVTQVLSRLSYIATIGMMTRITSQFEKTRKVSGPRSLQPSQWGVLCPSDTPEGEACGLVKNLALMAHVTTEVDEQPVIEWVYSLGVGTIDLYNGEELQHKSTFVVMVNGNLIGLCNNPTAFVARFRKLRRAGHINHFVSVYINEEHYAVYISTDGGRLCRPLLIIDDGHLRLTQHDIQLITTHQFPFEHLLNTGKVEYLDVNEQNNSLLCIYQHEITPFHTHMEIDPMTILGVVAGLIPYPHHNQSPRNTYQCAMGKQAMGVMGYNQNNRLDTLLYLLVYPQRPMCQTHTIEMINFDKLPAGQSATVFVMSYTGYDIEDASILNRAALDRGFGRCMLMKKNVVSLKQYGNNTLDCVFAPPQVSASIEATRKAIAAGLAPEPAAEAAAAAVESRFKALDSDGLAKVGIRVRQGDLLVNKYVPIETESTIAGDIRHTVNNSSQYKAQAVTYRNPEESFVDQVLLISNDTEHMTIKLLMRSTRRPELGDKFSSRHGQKGVCGLIVQQEDMPFTDQGVSPDLIMNPHGFPSRMTVGKMLELVAGKAGVLNGRFAYGTAFGGDRVKEISRGLISRGFSPSGKEIVNCGMTGEPMPGLVFAGPIFYQKLKHMVLDKMHARSRGPRAILTRQPTEGRSRDGGLRLGEMERDCLLGYGAASVVSERLMHSADSFSAHVCLNCGLICPTEVCQSCAHHADDDYSRQGKPNKFPYTGPGSQNTSTTVTLALPYACKLLFQELQSMNILPRIRLETL